MLTSVAGAKLYIVLFSPSVPFFTKATFVVPRGMDVISAVVGRVTVVYLPFPSGTKLTLSFDAFTVNASFDVLSAIMLPVLASLIETMFEER